MSCCCVIVIRQTLHITYYRAECAVITVVVWRVRGVQAVIATSVHGWSRGCLASRIELPAFLSSVTGSFQPVLHLLLERLHDNCQVQRTPAIYKVVVVKLNGSSDVLCDTADRHKPHNRRSGIDFWTWSPRLWCPPQWPHKTKPTELNLLRLLHHMLVSVA